MFRLDYLSCFLTVLATILVGRKMWTGLIVSGVNSLIVCVIGLHTSQYGFIPANVFCICINAFNLRAWLKVQKDASESTTEASCELVADCKRMSTSKKIATRRLINSFRTRRALALKGVEPFAPTLLHTNANVGVTFLPNNMLTGATTAFSAASVANPKYFGIPTFYISDLGPSVDPTVPGELYQIDAFAYGSSQNTVAVVESTYAVYTSSSNRTL